MRQMKVEVAAAEWEGYDGKLERTSMFRGLLILNNTALETEKVSETFRGEGKIKCGNGIVDLDST